MRHRITSFPCVEADLMMSLTGLQSKTCNVVNIRQSSCLRAENPTGSQVRQSSITRAASDHDGNINGGCPETLTAIRPRLNATASSSASKALNVALIRAVEGLKLAGTLRVRPLVHRLMNGAAPVAGLEIVTCRVGRA